MSIIMISSIHVAVVLSRWSINWLISCWMMKLANPVRQVQEFLSEEEGSERIGPSGLGPQDGGPQPSMVLVVVMRGLYPSRIAG